MSLSEKQQSAQIQYSREDKRKKQNNNHNFKDLILP